MGRRGEKTRKKTIEVENREEEQEISGKNSLEKHSR
jgi:hypothetical protein